MSPARSNAAPRLAHGAAPLIELWLVDLLAAAAALDDIEHAVPRLSSVDLEKIESISDKRVRRERRATYIALRVLLERAHGRASVRRVSYSYSDSGKPHLPDAEGDFSLSHAPGYALIGISQSGPIGVDLEAPRDAKITDERRERIEQAAAALAPDAPLPRDPQTRLLQAWVRLEALAKAEGCGLARLLTRYGILGRSAAHDEALPGYTVPITADGSALRVVDLQFDRQLVGAIACAGSSRAIPPRLFPIEPNAIAALLAKKRAFGR